MVPFLILSRPYQNELGTDHDCYTGRDLVLVLYISHKYLQLLLYNNTLETSFSILHLFGNDGLSLRQRSLYARPNQGIQ